MDRATTRKTMKKAKQTASHFGLKGNGHIRSAHRLADKWTQKVQDNLESFTDAASGYVEQGRQSAKALSRTTRGQIKKRPLSAFLLATVLGFLLGVIFMRR
jgi:ElaB/YqjD/DUF883 family membrane-anchored ribosome-binding protein